VQPLLIRAFFLIFQAAYTLDRTKAVTYALSFLCSSHQVTISSGLWPEPLGIPLEEKDCKDHPKNGNWGSAQVIFCPESLAQTITQLSKLCPALGLHVNKMTEPISGWQLGQLGKTLRDQPRAQWEERSRIGGGYHSVYKKGNPQAPPQITCFWVLLLCFF
jgi:hypothetical protein